MTTSPSAIPTNLTAQILASFIREASFQSDMAPYELKTNPQMKLGGSVKCDLLPEPGHWRLTLNMSLSASLADTTPVFHSRCTVEAIVVLGGFTTPEQVHEIMVHHFVGLLLGTARERFSSLSYQTGFPSAPFPAFDRDALTRFASGVTIEMHPLEA